jgi:hypothetical protein
LNCYSKQPNSEFKETLITPSSNADTVLKIRDDHELDPINSGFAAGCDSLKRSETIMKIDPINSGFAAGCESLKRSETIMKIDPINSGFAAGCEARLCLAVKILKILG